MERIKVALLAVIALALCLLVAKDFIPEAHAESGTVECNAWSVRPGIFPRGAKVTQLDAYEAKSAEAALSYATSIRDWLMQHPGQPVYRSSLSVDNSLIVEILCVR